MIERSSIEELAEEVKKQLDGDVDKKKVVALYAFNGTGKTRITRRIDENSRSKESSPESVTTLCYNSLFEDNFTRDNRYTVWDDNMIWDDDLRRYDMLHTIKFQKENSRILQLIAVQGLEKRIIDNFSDIIDSKLEPQFNFYTGEINFTLASGDDRSMKNIKISRGEESIFIRSIFFTILEVAIEELSLAQDERSTAIFDNL